MKNLSPRTQGLIAINLAAIIFGCTALFGKLNVSPFWIVALRADFAAITLFLVSFYKKDFGLPSAGSLPTVVLTGVILTLHWLTFFASVQWAGVAIATLTFATFPLFTIIIENIHHRRPPHMAELIAGISIIIAVGLLSNPNTSQGNLWGAISGLVSALTFAWFSHTSKQLNKELSPLRISLVQNTVVAMALTPILSFARPSAEQPIDWLWLILLGVVATAAMHQVYFYALRRLSAGTCSGFVALEPVYAILFAAILFHEPITLWTALSGVLIIGASFTLLRLETRQNKEIT